MKIQNEFDKIAPIFEAFSRDYDDAEEKYASPDECFSYALKKNLNHADDAQIREFIAEIKNISSDLDNVVKDVETGAKFYGWSAENWAYRRILDKMRNDEEDEDYWKLFDKIFHKSSDLTAQAAKKDTPDLLLSSGKTQAINNRKTEEQSKEKDKVGAEFGAQFKKTTNIHYQRAMKIDANNFDVRTNDMIDIANRLSKNVAMAGVGEMAIAASFAIAANAVKNRSMVGGGELAKILLKSGTDSAVRQILIGSLKVGAEKIFFLCLGVCRRLSPLQALR